MTAHCVLINLKRLSSMNMGRTSAEGGSSMVISVSQSNKWRPLNRATARTYPAGMLIARDKPKPQTTYLIELSAHKNTSPSWYSMIRRQAS